jgi:hypothetical protein
MWDALFQEPSQNDPLGDIPILPISCLILSLLRFLCRRKENGDTLFLSLEV